MKKSIILFATLMVCIAMALCVSCSKDDDKSSSNPVVGTWEGSIGDEFDIIFDFRSDNTGIVTMTEESYFYGHQIHKYDFTYKMYGDDSGYAIVEYEDYDYSYGNEYERVDFELNEKIMYVYSSAEYYDNELICVLHKQ